MKRKVISISSGEYVYHQIFNKAVGKIINGEPTGRGNDGKVVQFGYNTALKLWHEDLNPAIKDLSKIREIIFNVLLDNEIKEFIENDEELSYAYELIIKNQSEELSTFLYEVYVRISNKEKKRIRTLGDFKIS